MNNSIVVFLSYFAFVLIGFNVLVYAGTKSFRYIEKSIVRIVIMAFVMALVMTILLHLINHNIDITTALFFVAMGFIQENVFMPIIMGNEFDEYSKKDVIVTIISINLLAFLTLYFLL